jgi:hypothetical protein
LAIIHRRNKKVMDEKQKERNWYAVLYLLILILLFQTFPKAAYGVLAITLLVILFNIQKKK